MKRNVLVVVGSVILSFVLLSVGGWIFLQTSSQGEWIRESAADGRMPKPEETIEKYGDPFDMMARGMRVMQFVLLPIVGLLTGTFVGLFARRAVWQTAAISLIPLALLVLAAHSWTLKGLLLSCVYTVLCSMASLLLNNSCDWYFKEGESYLVYAHTLPDGNTLGTHKCTRTGKLDDAAKDLEVLGEGQVPNKRRKSALR